MRNFKKENNVNVLGRKQTLAKKFPDCSIFEGEGFKDGTADFNLQMWF